MADPAHELTDKKLEEMEKRLTAIYSRAEKEIQKTADDYFAQFKRLDAEKRELVKSGQLTEKEYKTWRRNKMLYSHRFGDMKEQCAQQLLHVNETALAYINGQLPEVYSLNYNALRAKVDGIGGYSFTLTDPQTIRHLSLADESLLPFKELDPAKDIAWNMKKINGEVLQGIITGDSIPKMAARVASVEAMNLNAAVRTARTIVTEAENKGRLDSFQRAADDGIKVKKQWMSTLDSRTRFSHAKLDGQIRMIDHPFTSPLGHIMFPGDPDADSPADVYNCRCTMIANVGQTRSASRIARDADGNSVLTENMSYAEWRRWRQGKPIKAKPPTKPTRRSKPAPAPAIPPQPLEKQGLSPLAKDLGEDFVKNMEDYLDKCGNPNLKNMYHKFGDRLKVTDTHLDKGAFFNRFDKGIHINAAKVALGDTCHRPYQTVFHEFGHNIDFLAGDGRDGYFSINYKSGKLIRLIQSDYEDFKRSKGNPPDWIVIYGLKEEKKQKNKTLYAIGSLSDILEGCTGVSYPLGVGHGAQYHEKYGSTAKEFFAEVCDATAANHESLEEMRRVFPKSVALVEEMMEVLSK